MNYANYDNLLALMPQLAAKVGSSIVPWQENTLYSQGQVVLYDYNLYQCTVAHTSTSTFDDTKFHIIGGGTAVAVE